MRLFTPEQANQLIPKVEQGLDGVRSVMEKLRDVRDQLNDLRIVWGDQITDPTCGDHAEYSRYREEFVQLEQELSASMERVTGLGVEVKDPDLGLVDFYAARGEEIVYLCWMRGEEEVRYWHSLSSGYSGRQPITSF